MKCSCVGYCNPDCSECVPGGQCPPTGNESGPDPNKQAKRIEQLEAELDEAKGEADFLANENNDLENQVRQLELDNAALTGVATQADELIQALDDIDFACTDSKVRLCTDHIRRTISGSVVRTFAERLEQLTDDSQVCTGHIVHDEYIACPKCDVRLLQSKTSA